MGYGNVSMTNSVTNPSVCYGLELCSGDNSNGGSTIDFTYPYSDTAIPGFTTTSAYAGRILFQNFLGRLIFGSFPFPAVLEDENYASSQFSVERERCAFRRNVDKCKNEDQGTTLTFYNNSGLIHIQMRYI